MFKQLAPKLGLVDVPGGRKQHQGAVPVVGGLAIFLGFTIGYLTLPQSLDIYRPFFVCAILIMLLGLADDLRELSARSRLIGQIGVAIIAVVWGGALLHNLGNLIFTGPITLSWCGYLLSILAIVGFMNAFNMLDGNDGLCGSLAFIQLGFIALLAWVHGDLNAFSPLILLCTTVGVFLLFNFPLKRQQANVFLGDVGSMLLGLAIAWYCIRLSQGQHAIAQPATFLWIIAIPLFDCCNVVIKRLKNGYSPMEADREHVHHILLDRGFSSLKTVCVIDAFAILFALIGVALSLLHIPEAISFILFIAAFIVYCMYDLFLPGLVQAVVQHSQSQSD